VFKAIVKLLGNSSLAEGIRKMDYMLKGENIK
jgi:hypothetical protein